MFGIIRHEDKKAFANAAQALEGIFSWRAFFAPCVSLFLNFVLAFLLNLNERQNAIPCGRKCNNNLNKVESKLFHPGLNHVAAAFVVALILAVLGKPDPADIIIPRFNSDAFVSARHNFTSRFWQEARDIA
jgi:hypothetical protein